MTQQTLREVNMPYTVNPDDEAVGRETVIIRRNGEPVAAVIPFAEYQDLLALKPHPAPKPLAEPVDAEFEKQWAALQRMMPELLQTHAGQWVAIVNEKLVASGPVWATVFEDVFNRLGDVPMCIHEVRRKPRVYKMESPHIVRGSQSLREPIFVQELNKPSGSSADAEK